MGDAAVRAAVSELINASPEGLRRKDTNIHRTRRWLLTSGC